MPILKGKFHPAYLPFSSAGKPGVKAVRSVSDIGHTLASASAALDIPQTLIYAAF